MWLGSLLCQLNVMITQGNYKIKKCFHSFVSLCQMYKKSGY